ncbi:DUF4438 domain-containing protein [Phycicoccus sp. DTK01]|uniref:DUF4438 family protein n=1 Tax=Phycicoccus sp. DTK01 TaxID=2785745 RepID=UPI001A8EFFD0|nr:DUF4438 domain-containing protein [Phycicoccus sp. DTK01]GIL34222.1 DUF4438 domain-containing protein [Phycicoccus sp. DTK01]
MIPVAMNLAGTVESPTVGPTPYRVDRDGRPYVPVGDGGVVLGVHLGDPLDGVDGDHVAPGATLAHPDPAASLGLTTYACIGNPVTVRDGAAAGARGWVLGKRGEHGRVLVTLPDEALAVLRPGDGVSVRAYGQGAVLPGTPDGVQLLNLGPGMTDVLGIAVGPSAIELSVRVVVPGRLAGNGVGRPAHQWDVDLAFPAGDPDLAVLRFGDLVAVTDLDVRHNIGFRRGWTTVGVLVHGDSPQPGHGPGITPVLTGPSTAFELTEDRTGPTPLTWDSLAARPVATGAGRRAR